MLHKLNSYFMNDDSMAVTKKFNEKRCEQFWTKAMYTVHVAFQVQIQDIDKIAII